MVDIIVEVILLVLFKVPGAFFRWLFSGRKRPLKDFIENGDAYLDGTIGVIVIVAIILLITKLI